MRKLQLEDHTNGFSPFLVLSTLLHRQVMHKAPPGRPLGISVIGLAPNSPRTQRERSVVRPRSRPLQTRLILQPRQPFGASPGR